MLGIRTTAGATHGPRPIARIKRRRRRSGVESLEGRQLLATDFAEGIAILQSNSTYNKSIYAADFDGDDDQDLVVASLVDDKVLWFENTDSKGTYSEPKTISDTAIGAATVFAADLDGDGDPDVISGGTSAYDDDVSWYRNEGGGNFSEQLVISAEVDGTDSVFAADINGDGSLDVVSASRGDNKVAWYANDGDGNFGEQNIVTDVAVGATSVFIKDLNGDGTNDLLAASYYDGTVRWFANDGTGEFSDEVVLTSTADSVTAVHASDMDNDGDIDVVIASRDDDSLSWFINDGSGVFSPEQFISIDGDGPNELSLMDFDGDTLTDIVVANRSGDNISWHRNLGNGFFGDGIVINDNMDGASAVFGVDIDGDGDLDLAATSRFDNKVVTHQNLDGAGTFGPEILLTEQGVPSAQHVTTGDVDNDGDQDVLFAAFNIDSIGWLENLGNNQYGQKRIISEQVNGPETIIMVDVDLDGDGDIVSASYFDAKIAWYENLDGQGSFGPQRVISGDTRGTEYIDAADIDGDGDIDILSASRDNRVAWYPNLGNGRFGAQVLVSEEQTVVTYVMPVDIDGDGDLDIVANGYDPDDASIGWYENVDGDGTFGELILVTVDVSLPTAIDAGDFDGDGDIDLAVSNGYDGRLLWYRNSGDGDFEDFLVADGIQGAFFLRADDLDNDNDPDLAAIGLLDGIVRWFENEGGQFGAEIQLGQLPPLGPSSLETVDINGDGWIDILVSDNEEDRIWQYTNLGNGQVIEVEGDFNGDSEVDIADIDILCGALVAGGNDEELDLTGDGSVTQADMERLVFDILETSWGDANLDGVFNSSDFVDTFIVGEYEDDTPGNSTWAEGDWNCDGDFTSADLVLALTAGTFSATAQPADASLPAVNNENVIVDLESIAAARDDEDHRRKRSPFVA